MTVFAVALAMPVWMALEGGAYDIVIRQEIAMLVWALVAIGVALGFLPRTRVDRRLLAPIGVFGAFLAFNVLSLLWTGSAERTLEEIARVALYGGVMVLALLSVNGYTWRAAAGGLSAALGVVACLAVLSRLFPDQFPTVAEAFSSERLDYPLGYWNAVACWGAMAIASGLSWSAHARTPVVRALALASVPFASLVVYLAYSRGGVIATGVAVIAAVALARNRWTVGIHAIVATAVSAAAVLVARGEPAIADGVGGAGGGKVLFVLLLGGGFCAAVAVGSRAGGTDRLRLPLSAGIAALAATAALVVGGLVLGSDRLSEKVEEFKDGTGPAVEKGEDPESRLGSAGGNRYQVWEVAVDGFQSARFIGIGPGTFEFYWSEHSTRPEFLVDAHSLYMEQLAELGVIGFLLLAAFLLTLIGAVAAARRDGLPEGGAEAAMFAVFAVWLFYAGIDWIWEMPAITAVALAAMAVAIGGASPRRSRRRSLSWPIRAAIIAIAIAGAAVQIPGIVSNERARAAETARLNGDPIAAITIASDAVAAAPWAASPRHVRSLAELDAGRLVRANDDALAAIDREAANRWHWLLAARVAIARKRPQQARQRLNEAIRLNGKLPLLSRFFPLRSAIEARIALLETPPGEARAVPTGPPIPPVDVPAP